MAQDSKLKVRNILAYILPFIAIIIYSLTVEYIGNIFLPTNILLVKYSFDLFISITVPIVFLLTGFFVSPINKKKTIKILSIILCVMTIIVITSTLDSPLQLSTYVVVIVVTIITFLILNKKML